MNSNINPPALLKKIKKEVAEQAALVAQKHRYIFINRMWRLPVINPNYSVIFRPGMIEQREIRGVALRLLRAFVRFIA